LLRKQLIRRFVQELVPKLTEFWNKLRLLQNFDIMGMLEA